MGRSSPGNSFKMTCRNHTSLETAAKHLARNCTQPAQAARPDRGTTTYVPYMLSCLDERPHAAHSLGNPGQHCKSATAGTSRPLPTMKELTNNSAADIVPAVRLHAVAGHPNLRHHFGGVPRQPAPSQLVIQERRAWVAVSVAA